MTDSATPLETTKQQPPDWFSDAIQTPYATESVVVNGCIIRYQTWGSPDKPGLFLLHGNGAHSHWWDFIAPSFMDEYYVVAPSLSGMGDSDHRDSYNVATYVDEIKAVCEAANFVTKPLLIGHSMGGRLVFNAEKKYPDDFYGVIMADSPFHTPGKKFDFEKRRSMKVKPHRTYEDFAEAVTRFRLSPAQPCENEYIVRFIGENSLKPVEGGWQWKFDPTTYSRFDYENMLSPLPETGNKIIAMVYGSKSDLFPEASVEYNQRLFAELELEPLIKIGDAYHHLFLDQPLAFIKEIKNILANIDYGKAKDF